MNAIWFIIITIIIISVIVCSIVIVYYKCIERFNVYNYYSTKELASLIKYKPSFTVVTFETRDNDYIRLHNENLEKYCTYHGYKYIFLNSYENVDNIPIYWLKLKVVLATLSSEKVDYVLWLDSDTIITKPSLPLTILLKDKTKHIYSGVDMHNIIPNTVCAGVFIIRNSQIGRKFISDCLTMLYNNKQCILDGKYSLNSQWAGDCYEQGVINNLLKSTYTQYFEMINKHILYNWEGTGDGQFIYHCYGKCNRLENFNYYNNQYYVKYAFNHPFKYTVNPVIILTCTVRPPNHISYIKQIDITERLNTIINVIFLWIKLSNLHIVIVENSNYDLTQHFELTENEMSRIEFITFDYRINPFADTDSKGIHELYAINYAIINSKLSKYATHIIKIGARLYVPEFEEFLKAYLKTEHDIVCQRKLLFRPFEQPCQIIGCKINQIDRLFDYTKFDKHVESTFNNIVSNFNNKLVVPDFYIPTSITGNNYIINQIPYYY